MCFPSDLFPKIFSSPSHFGYIYLNLSYPTACTTSCILPNRMDFSLSALGCSLPFVVSTKRRLALHENARQQSPVPDTTPRMNKTSLTTTHRDSFLVYLEHAYQPFVGQRKSIYQDDDTVTTASTSTAESEVEKVVTFSEPLITSIYTRPVTTREDKYYLHYSEYDYVDFKIEYMTGRQRNRKVSFAQEIEVHQVQPVAAEKNILFYSEIELQEFLDEFVKSLNQRF